MNCRRCTYLGAYEIRQMIDDIIDSGVKYAVTTPNLAQLKSYISSNQTNKSKWIKLSIR